MGETEDEKNEVRDSLSFYPLTGEIVSIGMINPDTGKGAVFFQNNSEAAPPFEEDGIRYEAGTEQEIIHKFWETIKSYSQFITFNGRGLTARLLWSVLLSIRLNLSGTFCKQIRRYPYRSP